MSDSTPSPEDLAFLRQAPERIDLIQDLIRAIDSAETDRIKELLGADLGLARAKGPQGVSLLLYAAYRGEDEIVRMLRAAVLASDGAFDLFEAAALGEHEALDQRLEASPDAVAAVAPDGFQALGLAAFFGRADAVELLLACGADPNVASANPLRVCPLHSAVAFRGEDAIALRMARALLDAGADPASEQAGGWTPLHQAAAAGRAAIVDLLLEFGDADALPKAESDDGRTPADMARERGHEALAARLGG